MSWKDTEPALTGKEREVLGLLQAHLTYGQVALRLEISVNTVRTHVREIYRKLEVGSRDAAVVKGLSLGMLT